MRLSNYSLVLWLTATTSSASAATGALTNLKATTKKSALRRTLQQEDEEASATATPSPVSSEFWGVQSGSANGHTDAGGMVYDHTRDEVILTGTTHDTQFFVDNGAAGVDCFVASVPLPDPAAEMSASQLAGTADIIGAVAAAHERGLWKFGGQHRVTTTNELDRCDLIARIPAIAGGDSKHEHTFLGGTLATDTDNQKVTTAVEPLIYEARIDTSSPVDKTQIDTSEPLKLFGDAIAADTDTTGGVQPKKNDLIIPAMMTTHHHSLYLATIHRSLVVTEASSTAESMRRIVLGIAKYDATDDTTAPLDEVWTQLYQTSILEATGDGPPKLTSGMFHGGPGLSQAQQDQLSIEQEEIEQEINQIEQEQEQYEHEEMHFDFHRHEYKNDGVLISGLEVIEVEDGDDPYILVAGSAPGTKGSRGTGTDGTTSNHPFMDTSNTFVGDWDGYVAKVNGRTGFAMQPANAETQNTLLNTWTYRLQTQPKRNDFIQSICVPRFPAGTLTNVDYYPSVVYAVGTTQGIVEGDKNGGAFIVQIDLDTMNILWKKQISGTNVHGMSCEVLVDVESHGTTTRADSKDLLYIAGVVHGAMTVQVLNGFDADSTSAVTTNHLGETDVWVAQLRASDGAIKWIQQLGTDRQDRLAKNTNNPSVSGGKQESNIGETGSSKGALAIDRHGHALLYGTSDGSLIRDKIKGDSNRDIFLLRLHRDDGSYQSIMEPYATSAPDSATTSAPNNGGKPESPIASSKTPMKATHDGATTDTSINYGVVGAFLFFPVLLGIIILVATGGKRPQSSSFDHSAATDHTDADLHVEFPTRSKTATPEHPSADLLDTDT